MYGGCTYSTGISLSVPAGPGELDLVPYLVVYSTTGYRLPATWVVCNVRNVDGGLDVR